MFQDWILNVINNVRNLSEIFKGVSLLLEQFKSSGFHFISISCSIFVYCVYVSVSESNFENNLNKVHGATTLGLKMSVITRRGEEFIIRCMTELNINSNNADIENENE